VRSVSLYSGCGGLDLGLERAGFRAVVANDSDSRCAQSYRANFPGVPFIHAPAAEAIDEIISIAGQEEIDLLAGGPPCPPYSKSRFYRKDMPRALKDSVGDETLAAYLTALEGLRPRAFLFENVAGFAYRVHREALNLLLETAEGLGYQCSWRVFNAADYGVPQMRERFLLIGMLDGAPELPAPTHAKRSAKTSPNSALPSWATAGQAIGDLDTEENADDVGHFAGGQHHELLRQVPPGENYLHFTEKRGHPEPVFKWRSRYWSFLLKLSPDLPSWTIQARRSNNMGPFHWRNRILRIEEVKRLQTFPDDWALAGTIEQQWRQVGNAVPPLLAERFGSVIASSLEQATLLAQAA
jgi:DNA (cytosine-5)-methyltransferase 1